MDDIATARSSACKMGFDISHPSSGYDCLVLRSTTELIDPNQNLVCLNQRKWMLSDLSSSIHGFRRKDVWQYKTAKHLKNDFEDV